MENADERRRRARLLVERCLRAGLPQGASLPDEEVDWIDAGFLDSMAHVDVVLAIERALGIPDLFAVAGGKPPTTTRAAIAAIQLALSKSVAREITAGVAHAEAGRPDCRVLISGWSHVLGSQIVPSESVEKEYGLRAGTLRVRAGLEQVRRASQHEDHVSLAKVAARRSLDLAGMSVERLRWIIATSETFLGYPSLSASLHTALLAENSCHALDVGGACTGLLNGLAVANALLREGHEGAALVVSSEVHSRALTPQGVRGQFGGLFGDAASAFVLQMLPDGDIKPYCVGQFISGCVGTHAMTLRVRPGEGKLVTVDFDGENLAHAALEQITRIINDLELRCGTDRESVEAFALHQPNPRLLGMILKHARLPSDKVPMVARLCGNLGSSTCGVALSMALDVSARKKRSERGPIFMAAVGPGMVWGGATFE